mmetsp:Transcript_128384/g.411502  ORF Transcript_128384/g.411502 Transcript_128384/m.411502 type:complete len:545 (-) Transcript_128384:830-2464(-)
MRPPADKRQPSSSPGAAPPMWNPRPRTCAEAAPRSAPALSTLIPALGLHSRSPPRRPATAAGPGPPPNSPTNAGPPMRCRCHRRRGLRPRRPRRPPRCARPSPSASAWRGGADHAAAPSTRLQSSKRDRQCRATRNKHPERLDKTSCRSGPPTKATWQMLRAPRRQGASKGSEVGWCAPRSTDPAHPWRSSAPAAPPPQGRRQHLPRPSLSGTRRSRQRERKLRTSPRQSVASPQPAPAPRDPPSTPCWPRRARASPAGGRAGRPSHPSRRCRCKDTAAGPAPMLLPTLPAPPTKPTSAVAEGPASPMAAAGATAPQPLLLPLAVAAAVLPALLAVSAPALLALAAAASEAAAELSAQARRVQQEQLPAATAWAKLWRCAEAGPPPRPPPPLLRRSHPTTLRPYPRPKFRSPSCRRQRPFRSPFYPRQRPRPSRVRCDRRPRPRCPGRPRSLRRCGPWARGVRGARRTRRPPPVGHCSGAPWARSTTSPAHRAALGSSAACRSPRWSLRCGRSGATTPTSKPGAPTAPARPCSESPGRPCGGRP